MKASGFAILALAFGPIAANAQGPGPPAIAFVTPNSAPVGSPDITISIIGSNFSNNPSVYWNASVRLSSSLLSTNQITATVPSTLLSASGVASIYVETFDGARSNIVGFTITGCPIQ